LPIPEPPTVTFVDPAPPPPAIEPTVTCSGCTGRKPPRLSFLALSALFAHTTTSSPTTLPYTFLLQPHDSNFTEPHPMALLSQHMFALITTDPDTMKLREALSGSDRDQFIVAMKKELSNHVTRKHWKVVPIKNTPRTKTCLPMVWSMKRKRNLIGETVKWKARLYAGGHCSVEFIYYWDTYSTVVSWQTICLVFTLAIVNDWYIHSIDFVMAFPQAEIKTDIYMRPPQVPNYFKIPDLLSFAGRFTKVYKLIKKLYGLKDAGRTWNNHLKTGLFARGWAQSSTEECLFTKKGLLLILYVDDACLISPSQSKILQEISSLQKDYDLTDEGPVQDYLGTRFDRKPDGRSSSLNLG